jgi:hypothetical protein
MANSSGIRLMARGAAGALVAGVLAAGLALGSVAAPASAAVGTKYQLVTAPEPTEGASFGGAVGISGTSAVVGAASVNQAYVFTKTDTTWSQQAELTVSGLPADAYFGSAVAISANTVVVGASGAPPDPSGPGAAYVFVRSGTTWSEQAELTASGGVPGDAFGSSVAISGNTVVVSADRHASDTGVAYVFVRSGTTWKQTAELTASDGAAGDWFGVSVALAGKTAVVGAYGHDTGEGAAYVFVHSGTKWSQQAELSETAYPDFGASVAVSGNTALIGALGNGDTQAGAAYVFVRPAGGTTWSSPATLLPSDGAGGDQFGSAVALAGTNAVVGANGHAGGYGAVYVFAGSDATWSQKHEFAAPTGSEEGGWGGAVAIANSGTAILGDAAYDRYAGAAAITKY